MENKKIEINLSLIILIILIVALIVGGAVYYFTKNSNSSSNMDTANNILEDSSQSISELNTNENTYTSTTNTNTQNVPNTVTDNNPNPTTPSENTSSNQGLSQYVGVWQSDFVYDSGIPDEEIIITSIDSTSVTFDYIKYRIDSYENIIAPISGNIATFDTGNNENSNNITGTITFSNNTVILTINSSTSQNTKTGSFVFKTKAEKSILK